MKQKILIAEDDPDIIEILSLYLESSGFEIVTAANGEEALEILKREKAALAIVDIMMPKMNGYTLIKEVRKTNNLPIIVLSAKALDSDRVLGLDIGADAYLTKPFQPYEVVAYVKALLRRYYQLGGEEVAQMEHSVLRVGELRFDTSLFKLTKGEEDICLTSMEMRILLTLMKSPGRVFTKAQLYQSIGGDYYENDANTMMVHISNIRSKIEDNPAKPIYLITVRGIGYKIEDKKANS